MNEPWYKSRRVWSAVIAGLMGIYAIVRTVVATMGIVLPELPGIGAEQVVDTIFGVLNTIAGALAFFSFLKPKK